ncbi:hypothetical protein [uncultured Tolumonas sp.]|uniref:hypothetical protein n=1 Tax=uncultured Tolumonas sp. TaxID=263765 RepID=UPI002A0A9F03|nr:hypothetical protein [uncultured Tolumonas sp.]
MKRKIVNVNELNVTLHPIIKLLVQNDTFSDNPVHSINSISEQSIQTLIEQLSLPVTEDPENINSYFLLKPFPVWTMLNHHAVANRLKIQLLVYEPSEVELVINTLIYEHTALTYFSASEDWRNLHSRWQQAKVLQLKRPKLNDLAELANRIPSSLRSGK